MSFANYVVKINNCNKFQNYTVEDKQDKYTNVNLLLILGLQNYKN